MGNLMKNFTSLYWWLTVVMAGIAINLASSYLKPLVDRRLSVASAWWRTKTERQKAERKEFIRRLCESEHEQILASFRDLRHRTRAIHLLVFGAFMVLVAGVFPDGTWKPGMVAVVLGVAGLSVFGSFKELLISIRLNTAVWEARDKRAGLQEANGQDVSSVH